MSDLHADTVECARHGPSQATYVCQHLIDSLRTGRHVGFVAAIDQDTPRPDAWCDACESKRLEHGGDWCDESEQFAGVTLLCGGCYDVVREQNRR